MAKNRKAHRFHRLLALLLVLTMVLPMVNITAFAAPVEEELVYDVAPADSSDPAEIEAEEVIPDLEEAEADEPEEDYGFAPMASDGIMPITYQQKVTISVGGTVTLQGGLGDPNYWSSSNSAVAAIVSSDRETKVTVVGVAPGVAKITHTYTDPTNKTEHTQSFEVTVNDGNGDNAVFTFKLTNASVRQTHTVVNVTETRVDGNPTFVVTGFNNTANETRGIDFYVTPNAGYVITNAYYMMDGSVGSPGIDSTENSNAIHFGYHRNDRTSVPDVTHVVVAEKPEMSVTITPSKDNVEAGDTVTLTVTVTPDQSADFKDFTKNVKTVTVTIDGTSYEVPVKPNNYGNWVGTIDYQVQDSDVGNDVDVEVTAVVNYNGDVTPKYNNTSLPSFKQNVDITGTAEVSFQVKKHTFALEFDGNGADQDSVPGTVEEEGGGRYRELTIPDKTPTKEGYKFLGWSDGETTYQPGGKVKVPADEPVTLTAQWEELLPELTIEKSVDKSTANVGETVKYTITVTNTGTADAHDVVVTDKLPDGLQQAMTGKTEFTEYIGLVRAGETKTVTISGVVATEAGTYPNTAYVTARGVEQKASNSVTVNVTKPGGSQGETTEPKEATLTVTKVVNGEGAPANDEFTIQVFVNDTMVEEESIIADGDFTVDELENGAHLMTGDHVVVKEINVPKNYIPEGPGANAYVFFDGVIENENQTVTVVNTYIKPEEPEDSVYTYTLTYDPGEGEFEPFTSAEKSYTGKGMSHSFTVDGLEPTREGYTFLGWSKEPGAKEASYTVGDEVTASVFTEMDVTLYAVWQVNDYTLTVKYVDDQGKVIKEATTQKYTYGEEYTVTPPEITGYTYRDNATLSGPVPAGDWTITLTYDRNAYTVRFDANGGTGNMDSVSVYYSDSYSLPECGFTAPVDKYFIGWSTEPDAAEVEYSVGGSYQIEGNVTFYAVWADRTVITVYLEGGEYTYDGMPHTGTVEKVEAGDGIAVEYDSDALQVFFYSPDGQMSYDATNAGTYRVYGVNGWFTVLEDEKDISSQCKITFVGDDLVIKPCPVTITVNDASKYVGNNDPRFSGTITIKEEDSPLTSERVEQDLGVTYSRINTDENSVGSYPDVLTANYNNDNGNYDVTVINGDFTINAVPPTPPTPPAPTTPDYDDDDDDDDYDPPRRPTTNIPDEDTPLTEIVDEETPLAALPNGLNFTDHYAYVSGYNDGMVHPEKNLTRAETAVIFYHLLDDAVRDTYWTTENAYSDVAESSWYNNAVSTLGKMGVLSGYNDGTFRPNAPITRAELMTVAVSFFDYADEVYEDQFTDVADTWARPFINAAAVHGLAGGYPDGTFLPANNITRAEAMHIINSVLGRKPHAEGMYADMITWPDNANKNAWYYADVQEATNSHLYEMSLNLETGTYETWTGHMENRDWNALEQALAASHAAGAQTETTESSAE